MTEKQKRFMEECKIVTISNKITDRFVKAAAARMEEISCMALAVNNPVDTFEQPLIVAAFKTLADTMYNALDATEQHVCDIFTEICEPTLYFTQEENKEGEQE